MTRKYHWIFDEGDNGEPTGTLIPLGVPNFHRVSKLTKLEHLQFDVFVDGSKKVNFGFRAIDFQNLKSLVLFGSLPRN